MTTDNLLIDTVDRICADHATKTALDAAEAGEFPQTLWQLVKDNGLHDIACADSGLELGDAFAVLRAAAAHALPLPLADAALGRAWLRDAGMGDAADMVSIGLLQGESLNGVPWGRAADALLGLARADDGSWTVHPCQNAGPVTPGANLAGEPRDTFAQVSVADPLPVEQPFALLALARTVEMAGALSKVLQMSLTYVTEREQFGRPIAKFQAIQHGLAVVAAEVAAASRASDAAVHALGSERFFADLAAAKSRVGEAVGIVSEAVHQVHGAMGFTHEHSLHHFTRRLWAWRDEYGDEVYWQERLGNALINGGAEALWPFLATRG